MTKFDHDDEQSFYDSIDVEKPDIYVYAANRYGMGAHIVQEKIKNSITTASRKKILATKRFAHQVLNRRLKNYTHKGAYESH